MEVQGANAEIAKHARSGHDEHARARQYPCRLEPFNDLTRDPNDEQPDQSDDWIGAVTRCSGPVCSTIAVGHGECGDAVSRRRVFRIWTDARDGRIWQVLASILNDGLQCAFIAQVLRPEIAKEADRPRLHATFFT